MGKRRCPLLPCPALLPSSLGLTPCTGKPGPALQIVLLLPCPKTNKQTKKQQRLVCAEKVPLIYNQEDQKNQWEHKQGQEHACSVFRMDCPTLREAKHKSYTSARQHEWLVTKKKKKNRFKGYTCLPSCTTLSSPYCFALVQWKSCD